MDGSTSVSVARKGCLQFDVPHTHVHCVSREPGTHDDGFGLVDIQRVIIKVAEGQRDVEVVASVYL